MRRNPKGREEPESPSFGVPMQPVLHDLGQPPSLSADCSSGRPGLAQGTWQSPDLTTMSSTFSGTLVIFPIPIYQNILEMSTNPPTWRDSHNPTGHVTQVLVCRINTTCSLKQISGKGQTKGWPQNIPCEACVLTLQT